MPETLTESFCERCGTRYTFEAAAPKGKRLGKLKTFSKGFVNFVTNDETSLDEAFAEARSEEQRELTNQQLDAFHQTFQFCMSCRQYTCANCWNETESRCLSCAPLGTGLLGTPFPALDPLARIGFNQPPAQPHGTNGNGHPEGGAPEPAAWPVSDLSTPDRPADGFDLEARLGLPALTSGSAGSVGPTADVASLEPAGGTVEAVVDDDVALAVAEAERARAEVEADAAVERERQAAAEAEMERARAAEAEAERQRRAAAEQAEAERQRQAAAEAEAERQRATAEAEAERQRQAAAEHAEAERQRQAAAEAEAERARAAEAEAERQRQAAAEAEDTERARQAAAEQAEAVRARAAEAEAERQRQAAALAAAISAAPSPSEPPAGTGSEIDRAAAAAAQTSDLLNRFRPGQDAASAGRPATEPPAGASPTATPTRDDLVETPTWQIVAPEAPTPGPEPLEIAPAVLAPQPPLPTRPSPTNGAAQPTNGAPQAPSAPSRDWPTPATTPPPQWPMPAATAEPQWPAPRAGTTPDVWAASSQEVTSRAGSGIQACLSCGLPLSASARFCRRCGTQQH
jgi:ribosomal protein L40E